MPCNQVNCACQLKPREIVCGPDVPYCGPALRPPTQYLYWCTRPMVTYTSTDDPKNTWNLKQRSPDCADVLYQEMHDTNGQRYY